MGCKNSAQARPSMGFGVAHFILFFKKRKFVSTQLTYFTVSKQHSLSDTNNLL
jgi:hypothetical protein